jgi:L-malate glycosyltransferase
VPERQGVRILLGIRRPPEGTASRAELGFSDRDVLLITIGRLIPRKAVDQLIHLVARLRLPYVHLLVVGSGPLAEPLAVLARELGVHRRVHFLGHVSEEEKFRLLRMSDILCSASQHEGFGLTYLEAMACGRPVITYDHGGQGDFLEDGETGYLVRLNDRAMLEARCRALIASPEARRAIGAANLRRAGGLLIDSCARQYEALFAEVIARHGG